MLAANLLCRLPDPEAFLRDCAKLVRPDGVLVLVSPHSWLEAWTPKHKWLGGARSAPGGDDEKKKTNRSFAAIRALLESPAGGFDLVDQTDLPFLIKEHDWKFQWVPARHGVAQAATKHAGEVARRRGSTTSREAN